MIRDRAERNASCIGCAAVNGLFSNSSNTCKGCGKGCVGGGVQRSSISMRITVMPC